MRCDVIAEGVVEAARKLAVKVPLVVRLEGTNAEAGKGILAGSGLNIVAAADMADGAEKGLPPGKGGGRMSIYVNRDTRVLVQGMTGSQGRFHAEQMLAYGTRSSAA